MISYLIWSAVVLRFILCYFSCLFFRSWFLRSFRALLYLGYLSSFAFHFNRCYFQARPDILWHTIQWGILLLFFLFFFFSFYIYFRATFRRKQLWIVKMVNWMKRTSRIKWMKMRECFQWICGMRYGDWAQAHPLLSSSFLTFVLLAVRMEWEPSILMSIEKSLPWKSSYILIFLLFVRFLNRITHKRLNPSRLCIIDIKSIVEWKSIWKTWCLPNNLYKRELQWQK